MCRSCVTRVRRPRCTGEYAGRRAPSREPLPHVAFRDPRMHAIPNRVTRCRASPAAPAATPALDPHAIAERTRRRECGRRHDRPLASHRRRHPHQPGAKRFDGQQSLAHGHSRGSGSPAVLIHRQAVLAKSVNAPNGLSASELIENWRTRLTPPAIHFGPRP